jgi:lambda family phage portal protein
MIERRPRAETSKVLLRVKRAARKTPEDRELFRTDPEQASRRIKARVDHELRMAMSERAAENFAAYEAADTGDRLRGEKWLTSKLTSNDQLTEELQTLIDRSTDLYRNDCYASSAINGRVDNVIGTGIRPQCRVQPERGILTPSQAEEFRVMSEWLFSRWATHEDFYSKQRQLERCNGLYGESWLHMSDEDDPMKPVSLAVQVVSPQRIPLSSYQKLTPGERRRLGLRLDKKNRPIAAYVRRSLPNDSQEYDSTEDEVDLDSLLHCYEEQFPGQLRGVPWLAPAMGRLKDLKDFVYANLVAEQVAACYSGFVTGVTDPTVIAANGRSRSNLEDLAPATIQYLGDGEGIQFSDPARPGSTLGPYVEWSLHGVAAALRYPYELLAKQFTNNFSGGRLALIDGRITFKVWQSCLIESVLKKVWARFLDRCVFQGAIKIDPVKYEANRDHFLQHAWIPPGWPWVDPEKEVNADLAAIAGGLQTETESLAARGRDFDETLQQRERESMAKMDSEARLMAYRRKLGLVESAEQNDSADQEKETANAAA